MRKTTEVFFLFFVIFFGQTIGALDQQGVVPFTAFTGKILKNRVRIRLQPSMDASIYREMNRGDLVGVVGESEDFYAIAPPKGTKAYVFRTFVLDNVVEGNHVNVRLEPDTEAPIIAQLNAGDRIEGTISPNHHKWLVVSPPPSTRFYISKDYIEKVGDYALLSKIEKQRQEAEKLLHTTMQMAQEEMQKPFNQIQLQEVTANLNTLSRDDSSFQDIASKAKETLKTIQEEYLQKKIAYLEARAQAMDFHQPVTGQDKQPEPHYSSTITFHMDNKMAAWVSTENALFTSWQEQNPGKSISDFYQEQVLQAVELKGILEPYNRFVKNKPGDFVLVNQANHLPIAYLYSTKVPLTNKIGQEVIVKVTPRPNHNFAYPAYFVLSLE